MANQKATEIKTPQMNLKIPGNAPRYTSYPTAPNFHQGVTARTYAQWLEDLPENADLSLYIHVPFCSSMCWFCGCHTKVTRRYDPVSSYLKTLQSEIELVAKNINSKHHISMVHFGGGSPTILSGEDFANLMTTLRNSFNFTDKTNVDMEIDPRGLTSEKITALTQNGVSRVSIGVQDFAENVQKAINREQTFEETKAVIEQFRKNGIKSINLDLLYGLPLQSAETIRTTLDKVNQLRPDRLSYFGYAHVPWMKKHQNLIHQDDLPDSNARLEQSLLIKTTLEKFNYRHIGIDHFALPDDSLAKALDNGTLKRNFQGYTTDNSDAIIGLGASAIGLLPQGYVQNTPHIGQYTTRIGENTLATDKGVETSKADKIRRDAIEQIMCYLSFSKTRLMDKFGENSSNPVIEEARQVAQQLDGEFITRNEDGFSVTEKGRPYARMICTHFDTYLPRSDARHSATV